MVRIKVLKRFLVHRTPHGVGVGDGTPVDVSVLLGVDVTVGESEGTGVGGSPFTMNCPLV